uniref:EGF-like domain-containing protein n=1 Tax=Ciona savignyi TaxID=51511 RepID=H2YAD3_CIOSA
DCPKKCNSNGDCVNGLCKCFPGYQGTDCSQVDCYDPGCSGHGVCVTGVCRCDRGWSGALCADRDSTCFTDCAGHGTYDVTSEKCICEAGWGGSDCSAAQCRPMCHPGHGVCVNGACRCEDGWTGDACHVRQCHPRCEEHGSCSDGVCLCDVGWNGDICTFRELWFKTYLYLPAGCPNDCSGHGNCVRDGDGGWYCACRSGWKSDACDVQVVVLCTNMKDDDLDTLRDCQDPDCCSHPSCTRTSQCRGGLDPSHEASRIRIRNPLPTTAPFHQRASFLVN